VPVDLLNNAFVEEEHTNKPEIVIIKPPTVKVGLLDAKTLRNNGIVLKRFR